MTIETYGTRVELTTYGVSYTVRESHFTLDITLQFFFFQAAVGIRDGHVTGVQTCALPICRNVLLQPAATPLHRCRRCTFQLMTTLTPRQPTYSPTWTPPRTSPVTWHRVACTQRLTHRSEERRVGRECTRMTSGAQ